MRFLASDQLPTDLSAKKMAANKARKDCPRVLHLIWVDLYLILGKNLKLLKISVNSRQVPPMPRIPYHQSSRFTIRAISISAFLENQKAAPCSNCRSCRAVTCCDRAPRCFQMVRRKCNLRRGRLVHVQRKRGPKNCEKQIKKTTQMVLLLIVF